MAELIDLIHSRRSIRKFTEQVPTSEQLEALLKAGMSAPTAMNGQPWEFIVVTDPEVLEKFRNALMFAKYNYTAVICVCGNPFITKSKLAERFWVQDCSAATENILLAATALGLGSVWIGVYPITIFTRQIREILNIPVTVIPLNLIGLGYPAEQKEPRSQYDELRVHWQVYAPKSRLKIKPIKFRKNEHMIEQTKED